MKNDGKLQYWFANLRSGWHIRTADWMTPEKADEENERVARILGGRHFRYVLDVDKAVAEWVEEPRE